MKREGLSLQIESVKKSIAAVRSEVGCEVSYRCASITKRRYVTPDPWIMMNANP
jgi:hypothetical protein